MKKILISVIALLCIISTHASAQPYYLIEQESPYTLKQMEAEGSLIFGYEHGQIPDYLAIPHLSFGIFDWLQIGSGFSYVYFQKQEVMRTAEYDVSLKARIFRARTMDFNLFAYTKYREAVGDLVTVPYEGSDPDVIAVVSPRADQGKDYTGGITGRVLLYSFRRPFLLNNLALMFGANYTRTENRDYYAISTTTDEGYKNRMSFSLTPALFFGQSTRGRSIYSKPEPRKNSVMFAVENRFTYWSQIGSMYDVIPQVNWQLSRSSAVFAGASIPVNRDEVYKFYVGASYRFYFWLCASIETGPEEFSPDGDGSKDLLNIYPKISSRKPIRSWKIIISDPSGSPFRIFRGRGKCPRRISWNGRSRKGELVESAQEYSIRIIARDVNGNIDEGTNEFRTGILFEKIEGGYDVKIILFKTDEVQIQKQYRPVLDRLAKYLLNRRYRRYRVEIQGHTDNRLSREHNLRLSNQRAISVLNYLAGKGVPRKRLSYRGFGESKPIASNRTASGQRKNRRVEFILSQ